MATLRECRCIGYTYYTYEEYCMCVNEVIKEEKKLTTDEKLKYKELIAFLSSFKQKLALQLKMMGIQVKELFDALMRKDVYEILKILKFNLQMLFKAIGAAQKLIVNGILKVLSSVVTQDNIILFRAKLIKIDDFIKKYPILKYLTGIALCGLLFWMWMNMTFIGDFDFDFDLTTAFLALTGSYTLYNLFGTDEGLLFLGLFFTGIFTPINFNWVLATPVLIPIMIIYTVSKNEQWKLKIKNWIKTHSQKVSTIQYKYQKIPKYDFKKTKLR